MELLVQHTIQAASVGEIGARELANVGYGAACSDIGMLLTALFVALAKASVHRMH